MCKVKNCQLQAINNRGYCFRHICAQCYQTFNLRVASYQAQEIEINVALPDRCFNCLFYNLNFDYCQAGIGLEPKPLIGSEPN